jgi:LAO/AO transport system kinase
MIRLGAGAEWTPPVVKTSAGPASTGTAAGVDEVWSAIKRHRAFLEADDRLTGARRRRLTLEVASLATERLRERVGEALEADEALRDDLAGRRIDPYRAAAILLGRVGDRVAGG